MSHIHRRSLLKRGALVAGGAVVGGGATAAGLGLDEASAGTTPEAAGVAAGAEGAKVLPADPRYPALTTGNNQRYVAAPEYVKMIKSTGDAVSALDAAVKAGKRVSVRSGGHCFADFVCHKDTQVILDFSEMTGIGYDSAMRAFYVEPGARLLNVYEALYKGWGVTVPGGICYSVGIGGHVAGGGFGVMSRPHGLIVDHLYAVEVVHVDAGGTVRTVRATREASDPNRELWWAHTGGGGGNFGLVTRYWFRSPGASGTEPGGQLIKPPSKVLLSANAIPWSGLDQASFVRLMKNIGAWHEANSAPDSKYNQLGSIINVSAQAGGAIGLFTQIDSAVPGASQLMDDYHAAITAGVGTTLKALTQPTGELAAMPQLNGGRELPWLQAVRLLGIGNTTLNDPTIRGAHKSAYLSRNFSDDQLVALHAALTDATYRNPRAMLILNSFGGKVNAVAPDATAVAQRGSVLKALFQTFWNSPADDAVHTAWLREMYAKFFAATGGVPGLDGTSDGCYINYADSDMADPAINTSGIAWSSLYYKGNYARLQQAKKKYDPKNVFRHSLSVALPGR
ncbi:FAD-binding protein [Streptomyces sp. NA04227]|uniref:FAD-dependent oxidoreductase n=1 Tax=Streptomyces sp. NA04227 TaxID=2742136 RepID=UPI00159193DF|nr:FAD-binding protein [Streptomyces sp. NA04227]QKW07322.1 FAD-binding protein [Streptomyces sp. NA04227]